MKRQLHRHVRESIDTGVDADEQDSELEFGRDAGPYRRVPRSAQMIARQLISMLSPSRTGKLTLT